MVVVSRHSIGHEWVVAEVDWAVSHKRSIIRCLFDDSSPGQVHPSISQSTAANSPMELFTVDFRRELKSARSQLAVILDGLLRLAPYPRVAAGRLGWR
jgi:hypothetical protein